MHQGVVASVLVGLQWRVVSMHQDVMASVLMMCSGGLWVCIWVCFLFADGVAVKGCMYASGCGG